MIHAGAIGYVVDDLAVGRLRYGSHIVRRTPDHVSVAGDPVAIQLHERGGLRGRGDDIALDLDRLHVAIRDLSQPFAHWEADSDVIWVVIPRIRLTSVLSAKRFGAIRMHRHSPRGRVLAAAIEHLWADVAVAPASRAPALAARIVDAARAVLRPGDFDPDRRSLALAAKDFIAANLEDLGLGVDALCGTFYASRSTMYRLFQPEGGVLAYIRDQRLLRSFDELASSSAATTSVSAIATRWGFENPSHFNRLFKAKFGVPPSVVARGADCLVPKVPHASATSPEFHARIHGF